MYGSGRVEFYWDYDDYYVGNPDYEAGLFLRENIRNFPSPSGERLSCDRFRRPKRIEIVSAPSDSMQCKYVHEFLSGLIERGIRPGKQTAIVLTDESLLLPVLYSIPEQIEQVNVTMGYPLRQTMAYSFVERLVELQSRRKPGRDGEPMYYHSDVTGLLLHPYVRACDPAVAGLAAEILRRQSVYVRRTCSSGLGDRSAVRAGRLMAGAFRIYPRLAVAGDPACRVGRRCPAAEGVFFGDSSTGSRRLENSLAGSGLEVTTPVFASLLRKMLQDVRIPYEGEPLSGVQIMGILETRNLDFEHVLVLSVNDDTFPGNRAVASSFIPYNLRYAYGLPTPQHHEGVYAYDSYRLLQRVETVHLAYCSRSDDKRTGEPSRYVYQLEYESPHRPLRRAIRLGVNLTKTEPVSASKTGRTARILEVVSRRGRALPVADGLLSVCRMSFEILFPSCGGIEAGRGDRRGDRPADVRHDTASGHGVALHAVARRSEPAADHRFPAGYAGLKRRRSCGP